MRDRVVHSGEAAFPLVAVYRPADRPDSKSRFPVPVGTAFAIDTGGTLLTANHVLIKTPRRCQPSEDGPVYELMGWMVCVPDIAGAANWLRVTSSQDCGGDIALLSIADIVEGTATRVVFPRCFDVGRSSEVKLGTGVWWCGFPGTSASVAMDESDLEVATTKLWLQAHWYTGSVVSRYTAVPPHIPELMPPAFLLDKPVMPGMSGAPLCLADTRTAIGIVAKGVGVKSDEIDPEGQRIRTVIAAAGIAVDIREFEYQPPPSVNLVFEAAQRD